MIEFSREQTFELVGSESNKITVTVFDTSIPIRFVMFKCEIAFMKIDILEGWLYFSWLVGQKVGWMIGWDFSLNACCSTGFMVKGVYIWLEGDWAFGHHYNTNKQKAVAKINVCGVKKLAQEMKGVDASFPAFPKLADARYCGSNAFCMMITGGYWGFDKKTKRQKDLLWLMYFPLIVVGRSCTILCK